MRPPSHVKETHRDWKLFTQGISNATEATVVKCQVICMPGELDVLKNFCNPRYLLVSITKERGNIANEAYCIFFLSIFVE